MAEDMIFKRLLPLVGGKDNISSQRQEGQRLFLRLKDESLCDLTVLETIETIKSCTLKNGQLQIVIGNNVSKAYVELCSMGGFEKQKTIDVNLDKKRREPGVKGTLKWIFGGIADGVSGCVAPLIPFIMVAGILRMIPTLFGDTWHLMDPAGDPYKLFTFTGGAGLYFLSAVFTPLGYALVCALWLLLTCGLHQVLIAMAIVPLMSGTPDSFIMSASGLSAFATYGVIAEVGAQLQVAPVVHGVADGTWQW